jgi:hypothetical protein
VFVHCLCWLGAIFSRAPGSHLLIRALGSQGRPQGPPRVRPNKTIRFPIRCPIRSYYSMILLAHIPINRALAQNRKALSEGARRKLSGIHPRPAMKRDGAWRRCI